MGYFSPRGRASRRLLAGRLRVPAVIENRYVLRLRRVLQAFHREYLKSVHYHQDARDEVTSAQVRHLKTLKQGGAAPGGGQGRAVRDALRRKGLIGVGNEVTPAGHEVLERLASEPLDVLGVRLIRAIEKPVGEAFDELAEGVKRANRYALVQIGPTDVRLGSELQVAREANIALMRDAGRSYADQVQEVLEDPENHAKPVKELAKLIQERAGVSESRGELIARDQTLKLNSAVNRIRQTNAGISRYVWNTSHDERVRESHRELDGQTFSWNDPPEVDGELAHPGEPILCRCVALPVFEDEEA